MQVTAAGQTTPRPEKTAATDPTVLGKDDFLKLLVAQLRNQDVFNPMQDKEMMAQLAQFNALDQMTQMKEALTQFLGMQQLSEASNLLGKQVEVVQEGGEVITGTVSRVSMADGEVRLRIGEDDFSVGAVTAILGGGDASVVAEGDSAVAA